MSENGRLLAEELDRLDRLWPVPVERVALVGHSMGGLLARSACRCAEAQGHRWVSAVSTVVTLGTPHLGAPLEKVVHLAERVLGVVPEAAPFARLLAGRSVGVRDLRFGALVEEDRARGDDPGLFQDPCVDVPLLGHATYGFVSASIGRGDRHPVGWLIGDGLVRRPSAAATGRTRRTPLAPHHRVHLSGLHHFNLLDHPDVYEHLRVWLA